MIKRKVQLVILCEDQQQEVFARHFFIKRGFNRNKIRSKICPRGRGSGEQFVRQSYPAEVEAYRKVRNYLTVALAVVIDADTNLVTQRFEQLEASIAPQRQPDEMIAIFIPKRNIETWLHYLQGNTVDEETSYPRLNRPGACKPLADQLIAKCHSGLDEQTPPSLRIAHEELYRILPQS